MSCGQRPPHSTRRLAFAAGLLLAACADRQEPAAPATASLPSGEVARVGTEPVLLQSVARVAESQRISPRAALAVAISDAIFCAAARERGPAGISSSVERSALARAVLEGLADQSRLQGPATEAELKALARERWLELDRPDAVVTTHAVVLVRKAEEETAARQLAEKLAQSVAKARDSAEFLSLAKGVAAQGLQIRAETLPAITRDGRSFTERGGKLVGTQTEFDVAYALAANALEQPSQQSALIKTKFGYHVIRLERRIEGTTLPAAEQRARLEPDALSRRGATARGELLRKLHQATPIEVDRAADELTSRLKIAP